MKWVFCSSEMESVRKLSGLFLRHGSLGRWKFFQLFGFVSVSPSDDRPNGDNKVEFIALASGEIVLATIELSCCCYFALLHSFHFHKINNLNLLRVNNNSSSGQIAYIQQQIVPFFMHPLNQSEMGSSNNKTQLYNGEQSLLPSIRPATRLCCCARPN